MTEAICEINDNDVYQKVNLHAVTVGDSFTIKEGKKKGNRLSISITCTHTSNDR
ncbi:hypothetical protein [Virgibacillus sp. DJP39]|uniref:hypothetical protein n=1 Tax=Virgibacillus sp. DJP39 TaxID=3409790 RepID=UPI003BB73CAD